AQHGAHHGQRGIAAVITDNVIAIDNKSVAMAYVPWQRWDEVYPLEKALECGTLFPELFKPFMGRR
ncbi:MAG: spore coat associated protein CotJA, partial [Angelakisella sp.]